MNIFLTLTFLFYIGSTSGWVLEFFYRRLAHKKWINPGFLVGPYLPLYGFGLCFLYVFCNIEFSFINIIFLRVLIKILILTICLTIIEYVAGIIFIKSMNIKLWDYSSRIGNIKGIICPLFSFFWGLIGVFYLFVIHPNIQIALTWLFDNLAYSFIVGFFFGVFTIDFSYSISLGAKIRKWATDKNIIVKLERLKDAVYEKAKETKQKINFLFPIRAIKNVNEELENYINSKFSKAKEKWKFFKKNKDK